MAVFKIDKVVSALPGTLAANTVYAVRVGAGFDLYISDSTGTVAHAINGGSQDPYISDTPPDTAEYQEWTTLSGNRYVWDGFAWFEVVGSPSADYPAAEAPDPLILAASNPATPATDTVAIFGRKLAGAMMPAYKGPSGLDSILQPFLARNKVSWANPLGNSATISYMGMTLSATGTATSANVATTNIHTAIKRVEFAVTSASTSAVAGFRYSVAQYHLGGPSSIFGGFKAICRFGPARGTTGLSTRRNWCGFSSAVGAPTDVDPSTSRTNAVGVGTDSGDTNWQIMHRTASGATIKVDTGFPKVVTDSSEMYELAIFTSPTAPEVYFEFTRLSDGSVFNYTTTTNLPDPLTLLGYSGYSSVGGTSSAIGISLASLYIETDY